MGVPGLFLSIIEKYPKCIFWRKNFKIQHFFIDFNGMIYGAFNRVLKEHTEKELNKSKVETRKKIIRQIIIDTRELISIINPTNLLYLSIDGPVPYGKINEQRDRRYMRVLEERYLKSKYDIKSLTTFSNAEIIPGTDFMNELVAELENKLKGDKYNLIVDSQDNVGEGEHKIMHNISKLPNDENILIYSNDGDMLILPQRYSEKKIYILRTVDNPLKDRFPNNEYVYVDINEYQEALLRFHDLDHLDRSKVIKDYMTMTFFGGNDFIPALPFTKVKEDKMFRVLLRAYKDALYKMGDKQVYLVSGKDINQSVLKNLFKNLAELEDTKIRSKYRKIKKYKSRFDPSLKDMPVKDRQKTIFEHFPFYDPKHPWYKTYIGHFDIVDYTQDKEIWSDQYYKYHFGSTKKDVVCKEYLKCVYYVFHYYLDELPSWTYYYPYHASPLPSDLYEYMNKNKLDFKFDKSKPPTSLEQMVVVNHRSKFRELMPSKLATYMLSNKSKLKDYHVDTFEIDVLSGQKYIYTKPLLPEIDVKLVRQVMKEYESK